MIKLRTICNPNPAKSKIPLVRMVIILVKSKFYKKRGATFFYDFTHKLGPLDFTQYRSKSSSFL